MLIKRTLNFNALFRHVIQYTVKNYHCSSGASWLCGHGTRDPKEGETQSYSNVRHTIKLSVILWDLCLSYCTVPWASALSFITCPSRIACLVISSTFAGSRFFPPPVKENADTVGVWKRKVRTQDLEVFFPPAALEEDPFILSSDVVVDGNLLWGRYTLRRSCLKTHGKAA